MLHTLEDLAGERLAIVAFQEGDLDLRDQDGFRKGAGRTLQHPRFCALHIALKRIGREPVLGCKPVQSVDPHLLLGFDPGMCRLLAEPRKKLGIWAMHRRHVGHRRAVERDVSRRCIQAAGIAKAPPAVLALVPLCSARIEADDVEARGKRPPARMDAAGRSNVD